MSDVVPRLVSAVGFLTMIGIAWAFSMDRRRVPWRTVAWGAALQLVLGLVLLKTFVGQLFFEAMSSLVGALLA